MFQSYQQAQEYMGEKHDRPVPAGYGRTSVNRIQLKDNGDIVWRYHNTDIVTFTPTGIIINNGGYTTTSTKRKINQAIQEILPTAYIFQKNHQLFFWRACHGALPFVNGMHISWGADVTTSAPTTETQPEKHTAAIPPLEFLVWF